MNSNHEDLMTTHTPWTMTISYAAEQPGIVEGTPVSNKIDAIEAASYLTPLHAETEGIDPFYGVWNVWLPNYMTRSSWESGVYIDACLGGYRLQIDLERL